MILTNQTFLMGVAAGLVLCYAFHHWGPANLVAASHGMKGAS
jgi:hypothetical protein